jgi:hypothetical protein
MIPYEPMNTQRVSAAELYAPEMPALMPLVNAYTPGEGQRQEGLPFPILAFDDDDEEDDDIEEEDNFDDMEDDFEDDFEDDDDDDSFDDDFEDEDYDDDYEEDVDYDEFDE